MKKIALVTGGNSGIGYATANLLKEKGYEVFISGRDAKRLQQAADELGVNSVLADMSKPEDIKRLAATFLESGLDMLVNNAGIAKLIPLDEVTSDNFSEVIDINLRGPIFLIKELSLSLEKRQGSVTNVSSLSSSKGFHGSSIYAATKGGIESCTRALAVELAPRKIRVNAITPGAIDTPIFTKLGVSLEESVMFRKKLESTIPLQRFGVSEEVAQVIVAQLEATYVTGAVWIVDGGVSVA
jgi:NAD(P)-dependent dehydrogenase (short-subunit alcohol dehydrogenase family)